MLLYRRDCEKCRDGYMVFVNTPVGKDDDIGTARYRTVNGQIELFDRT